MPIALHWLASQPTPYNNVLFSALAQDEDIALQVHFQKLKWPSHPWREPIDGGFPWRCYGRLGGLDGHLLRQAWMRRREFFVVSGWNEPTMLAVMLLRIVRGFPVAVWTDTPDTRRRSVAKRYARSGLLRVLFAGAERVMVTGEAGAAILRALGCPAEKIVIFPYWVPLPPLSSIPPLPVATGECEPVRFIAIGRIEPVKRFDVAVAALRMVVRELGPRAARLRLVGDGSERSFLEQQVREAGLTECVEFSGWQEHWNTVRLLSESDVLVHPAEWEPYGVGVLEAMAYGKPVIASDMTMASVDRIEHGISGFICRAGDVEEMAGLMKQLIVDRARMRNMGEEARRIAEKWPISRAVQIVKEMVATRPDARA